MRKKWSSEITTLPCRFLDDDVSLNILILYLDQEHEHALKYLLN